MAERQDRNFYQFYHYLQFFWQKKKWFLYITVPLLLIALVISFIQGNKYEATATFSLENVNEFYSDPDLVKANYGKILPEELKDNFQTFVPKYKKMKLQLVGNDQKQVESYFKQITNQYYQDMLKTYEEKLAIYKRYHETQKEKVEKLQATVELLRKKANSANSEELRLLVESERELAIEQQEFEEMNLELLSFEKTKPIYTEPVKIEKRPSPYISNLVLAGMLGLVATLFTLMIWKYLRDAKNAIETRE